MEPSHAIVKALADPARLRAFAQIVLAGDAGADPADLEERTIPRLLRSGLVTREDNRLHAEPKAFQTAAAAARKANPDAPADVAPNLADFYSEGRIAVRPTRRATRVALLRDLAGRLFEFDRVYTEREITDALATQYDDPLQLRRDLIDELFLERTAGGREYRRREAPPI
ncbi:DUF2087 domain-containing protein [Glycomyces arizonensis]|uniref:DUF2087 domain-containing protein n=1 Tax=Glycomyces arizonensis TaxID=256035 RepID=UPI0003F6D76A|nr:DUF2087 domain-containing protein [Glycomyces arizonensis]